MSTSYADECLLSVFNERFTRNYGPFYVGDWKYVHIWLFNLNMPANELSEITLLWLMGDEANASVQPSMPEVLTNYQDNQAYWCLPVRGPWLERITVTSLTPAGERFILVAKVSNTRSSMALNLLNVTTPVAVASTTDSYANFSANGKARVAGYLFNDTLGGVVVGRLYEVELSGALTQIAYVQTPVDSVANFVHEFDWVIPLSGKALMFRTQRVGPGLMNSYIIIDPYSDEAR